MSTSSLNGYRRHAGAKPVENRVGLLVTFAPHVSREEVQAIADKLVAEGKVDPRSGPRVDEFNPAHGYPVFYIP